jgi:hypothetical protein
VPAPAPVEVEVVDVYIEKVQYNHLLEISIGFYLLLD